jgi:hypothetical protein
MTLSFFAKFKHGVKALHKACFSPTILGKHAFDVRFIMTNHLTSFCLDGISPIEHALPSVPALVTRCGVWNHLCQLCRLSGLEQLLRGFSLFKILEFFPHFRDVFIPHTQFFRDFARAARPVNFLPVVLLAWPHGAFCNSPPHQLDVFHESPSLFCNLSVGLSPVGFCPIHGRGLRPVDSKPNGGPTAGANNVAHCSAQDFKFSSSISPGRHVARHNIRVHWRIHVGAGRVTIPPEELSGLVTVCGCGFERCAVCLRDNISVESIALGSHGLSDCLRECLGLGELGHSVFAGDNVVRFHSSTIRQPLAVCNNYFTNRAYFFCMLVTRAISCQTVCW